MDVLLPTLSASAQVVYLQLYRLSYGHGRKTCRIGHPRLAERTHLSQSTVRSALGQLEKRGLVTVREYKFGGAEQGTTYEIHLPAETPEDAIGLVKSDSPPKSSRLPDSGSLPDSGTMKVLEKNDERDSVYEIRTIAARLFEVHRGELGFGHERLRRLVRDALIGQGREPDDSAIDEAIRGMAV
jgi:DNA-binding transcriptional MocR family regulator